MLSDRHQQSHGGAFGHFGAALTCKVSPSSKAEDSQERMKMLMSRSNRGACRLGEISRPGDEVDAEMSRWRHLVSDGKAKKCRSAREADRYPARPEHAGIAGEAWRLVNGHRVQGQCLHVSSGVVGDIEMKIEEQMMSIPSSN